MKQLRRIATIAGLLPLVFAPLYAPPTLADTATVAVASNFLRCLTALQAEFEATTGHELVVVAGSTGQLYAQILNGAPFDVLLAADQERPRLLAEARLADASSRFTYAIGRLALWSREPGQVDAGTLHSLAEREFRWLAIANPELAPYGVAARQALEASGNWRKLEPRIVRGQNVAQAFALVETGNADLGLVALAQALVYEGHAAYAIVPAELHDPIRQDAVLLNRAEHNAAAQAFMVFLKGGAAAAIITEFGYLVDDR